MNIKNLLLTIGITTTTAAAVFSVKPKETINVNAVSNQITDTALIAVDEGTGYQARMYLSSYDNDKGVTIKVYRTYWQDKNKIDDNQYITTWIFVNNSSDTNYINVKLNTNTRLVQDLDNSEQVSYFVDQNNTQTLESNLLVAYADNSIDDSDPNFLLEITPKQTYTFNVTGQIALKPMEIGQKYAYVYNEFTSTGSKIYNENDAPTNPYNEYWVTGGVDLQTQYVYSGEVIDIGGLMIRIISMPFTFISTAFNLTLFPNTQYQINIGQFILGIIAVMTILFIIKVFTGGLDIIGNITQTARTRANDRRDNKGWTKTTTVTGENSKGKYSSTTTTTNKRNK